MIEKVRSLSTYINHKYNRSANVKIQNMSLPCSLDVRPEERKRKRAGSAEQSARSTPDLEVSFPFIDGPSPMTSYNSSPNSSNSSTHSNSMGKYQKKRKLRLNGDSEKHTYLVEQLVSFKWLRNYDSIFIVQEKSAQLVKEVKSGIMRQTTPTQDLMEM